MRKQNSFNNIKRLVVRWKHDADTQLFRCRFLHDGTFGCQAIENSDFDGFLQRMGPRMAAKVFRLDKVDGRVTLCIGAMEAMTQLKSCDGTLVGTDKTDSWKGSMFVIQINTRRNDRLIRQ